MANYYNRVKSKKSDSSSWLLPVGLIVAVGYIFKDILFTESVSVNPASIPSDGYDGSTIELPIVKETPTITEKSRELTFVTKTSAKAYKDNLRNDDID